MSETERAVIARLDVVLNEDIEAFQYSLLVPSDTSPVDQRTALESILRTVAFPWERSVGLRSQALAALVNRRPHARVSITHYVRDDGTADGELQWLGGGERDVGPGEHEALVDRARLIVAARLAAELESLEGEGAP